MASGSSEGERLAATVSHAMAGTPWHGDALRRLLDGVTAADAAAHPIAGAHSIWELVQHLTSWCHEVTRRVQTGSADDPADGDWPPVPTPPSEEAWRAACDALQAAHDTLATVLASRTDTQLQRRIGDVRDRALGTGLSVRATALGIAQHAAYHGGQIALLKKALISHRP